jgi:hypothetical protein
MRSNLTLQELAIAITAKNLNPTVLNPDFLKYTDIIPSDWEPARPPIYTNQSVQIVFQSGVAIVAQPNRVIFLEALNDKTLQNVQVAAIAGRYVEKLPNVEYEAVGINPKGYVTFPEPNGAYQYFLENILASGSWQRFGQAPVKAAVQLAYTLERSQLNLTINEATLQLPEEQALPAVLFSGNFNYEITANSRDDRLQETQRFLESWQADLETFRSLIDTQFLQQPATAIAG